MGGLPAVNEAFAAAVVEELDDRPGRGGLVPRLPPLPRADSSSAQARPDAVALALRPHSLAGARLLDGAARAGAAVDPRRAARQRRRRLPHGDDGGRASSPPRALSSAPRSTTTSTGRARRPAHARHRPSDLGRHGRVRRARRQRRGRRGGARSRADVRRAGDPARRSHRPVEEHRAGVPAPSSSTSSGIRRRTGGCACSRSSIRPGRTSRSTRPTCRRSRLLPAK